MNRAIFPALVPVLAGCLACGAPALEVRSESCEVRLSLDPASNAFDAHADLRVSMPDEPVEGRARLELTLHPALEVSSVEVEGATLVKHRTRGGEVGDEDIEPARLRLTLENPEDELRIRLAYGGKLYQDASAGEKEGQVHNFAMAAHVGDDGVYLSGSGHWYPEIATDDDDVLILTSYALELEPVEGFEFVAGLESRPAPDGKLRWSSPFPLDGMVLLGGPMRRWSRPHGDVMLHVVLPPDKEAVADDILAASAEMMDRYEPLVGPYPFSEFTVLEAFFSSGFAFPTCTQIVGSQLSAMKQYRRHGYLDHEMLHNWWGNGVFVDPADGNWCEALTSYLTNYYGYVLDGDEAGARKQRRNQSNFLSALKPEDDKPLGTFGEEDGTSRAVGYQKGAAVFHMLERRIGKDAFFEAMRGLTTEQMGKAVSWAGLQRTFEEASGDDLSAFFEQWIRRGGAPRLDLVEATWKTGDDRVAVTISQGETDFALDVPLRLHYGDVTEDVVVPFDAAEATVDVACRPEGLTAVELDPDYHVFRKLAPAETMPTSALSRRAEHLAVLTPSSPFAEPYQTVVDSFSRAVLGEEDDPKKGHEVETVDAGEVTAESLQGGSVLILGDAVRTDDVRGLLARTRSPVVWGDGGFTIEGELYDQPGQAVLFTVHHPDDPTQGITVYLGNSEGALANASVLSFYANSLLVFETPLVDGKADETAFTTKVIRRMDFESPDRIEL